LLRWQQWKIHQHARSNVVKTSMGVRSDTDLAEENNLVDRLFHIIRGDLVSSIFDVQKPSKAPTFRFDV